ncbi:uracil-DNA glycosylase family protein [Fundicoccus culcitae]|uniref:Uracil-DNA glycosylase family protein n=1 Tax=Fundicoccus culcitae TaxID=2969821 RepID=A0ABY5P321_9LACT|nr:uracil-DNA glycosylase family protein [Fundicoccus culcitae]UUX33131.1 uracil-DNA glycosylase family protein [Fundicoccus culcitae]
MDLEAIKQAMREDEMNRDYTQHGIDPLFAVNPQARLVIVGQAPGKKAQDSQLYWNDLSGDRLRQWMGIDRETFYNSPYIAQMPMDFYFPGKGKSGDLPPRKGFAQKWHPMLLDLMPEVETILLIGAYSQKYYLGDTRQKNLTETVKHYQDYLQRYLPLVHPSPLNVGWLKKNPWFEAEVIPELQGLVSRLIP